MTRVISQGSFCRGGSFLCITSAIHACLESCIRTNTKYYYHYFSVCKIKPQVLLSLLLCMQNKPQVLLSLLLYMQNKTSSVIIITFVYIK